MDAAIFETPPTTAFTSRRRLGTPVHCGRVVRRVAASQNGTEKRRQICLRPLPKKSSRKTRVFEYRFVSDLESKMVPKTGSKSSPAMRLGCLRPKFVLVPCGRRSPKVPTQASFAYVYQNPMFCDGFRAVELSLRGRSQLKSSDNHDAENHHNHYRNCCEIHVNRTSNDARK
jgi:hypothetical protein